MNDLAKKTNPMLDLITRSKTQIERALPTHMNADRMSRIVMTELRKTPQLMACEPKSFIGAVIQAAQLGLEPGGGLGHAYLIPYGKEATLIIGYRGMIDLARRSGQIISISAHTVQAADEFNYQFGLHEDLTHIPARGDRGQVIGAYAVARLVGGGVQFEYMSLEEIKAIQSKSKAGKSGPWVSYFDEMAKKTVIRRLFKYLPVSIEIQRAVSLDEAADTGLDQGNADFIEGSYDEIDPLPTADDLNAELGKK